jgi:hypothetical protein
MSSLSDVLAATKKILLITDDLKRLSHDSEALSERVSGHERRLIRLETIIEISQRPPRTLPGK